MSTYYVDSSATGSNNGTSWANAWTSFPATTLLSAGDKVYVRKGTGTYPQYSITKAGTAPTAAGRIWFIGVNTGSGFPVIFGIKDDNGVYDYIGIRNFIFTNVSISAVAAIYIRGGANGWHISNNVFYQTWGNGVDLHQGALQAHHEIMYNAFDLNGINIAASHAPGATAVSINGDRNLIAYNTFGCSNDSTRCWGEYNILLNNYGIGLNEWRMPDSDATSNPSITATGGDWDASTGVYTCRSGQFFYTLITAASRSSNVVTLTTNLPAAWLNGTSVTISGLTGYSTSPNVTATVTSTGSNTLTYSNSGSNESFTTSASSIVAVGTNSIPSTYVAVKVYPDSDDPYGFYSWKVSSTENTVTVGTTPGDYFGTIPTNGTGNMTIVGRFSQHPDGMQSWEGVWNITAASRSNGTVSLTITPEALARVSGITRRVSGLYQYGANNPNGDQVITRTASNTLVFQNAGTNGSFTCTNARVQQARLQHLLLEGWYFRDGLTPNDHFFITQDDQPLPVQDHVIERGNVYTMGGGVHIIQSVDHYKSYNNTYCHPNSWWQAHPDGSRFNAVSGFEAQSTGDTLAFECVGSVWYNVRSAGSPATNWTSIGASFGGTQGVNFMATGPAGGGGTCLKCDLYATFINDAYLNSRYDSNTGVFTYGAAPPPGTGSPGDCDVGYISVYGGNKPNTGFPGCVTSDPLFNGQPYDLTLSNSSPLKTAGRYTTLANGAGVSSTTLIVDDAYMFQAGFGPSQFSFPGDKITVGGVNAQIQSINYLTNTLTLTAPISWSDNAEVRFRGWAQIGAMPYRANGFSMTATYTQVGNTYTVTVLDGTGRDASDLVRWVQPFEDDLPQPPIHDAPYVYASSGGSVVFVVTKIYPDPVPFFNAAPQAIPGRPSQASLFVGGV